MQTPLQVGLPFHDQLDLTLELDGHLRLDLLGEIDLVEVDVQQIAVPRAPLNLAYERLAHRLVADLEIKELIPPHLLEGLDELPAVHRNRQGIDVVAIDDAGQPALPAKGARVLPAVVTGLEFERNGGGRGQ